MNRSLNRSTTGRAGRLARFARAAVLCAALGGTAASVCEPVRAQGSARSQAWDLRRSNPAEAARQLEEVVRADPSDAKAFWFLAMVYNDMNRSADGLRALESARRADPSLGFASSPAAVERMQRALSNGGGGTSTSNPSSPSGSTSRRQHAHAGWPKWRRADQLAGDFAGTAEERRLRLAGNGR
jgi:hypothetical protein